MNIAAFDYHDSGRSSKAHREIQLEFLRQRGDEYVTAWYLHQILDYLKWWLDPSNKNDPVPPIEDILTDKRLQKKIGNLDDRVLYAVRSFVVIHSEAILSDLRNSC